MGSSKIISKKNKTLIVGSVAIIAMAVFTCIYFKPRKNEEDVIDETKFLVKGTETYEGLNYTLIKENILKQSFFYDLDRGIEGSKIDVSY